VLILGAAAVFLARNNPGEWNLPIFCPFHAVTGLFCPGCGSLRAMHHILNLRFAPAFSHNPLAAALALLAPFAIVFRNRLNRSQWWGLGFTIVFGAFWVVRNL
jgi:hypothetical protein